MPVDPVPIAHAVQRDVVHYELRNADERVLVDLWLVLQHPGSATHEVTPHRSRLIVLHDEFVGIEVFGSFQILRLHLAMAVSLGTGDAEYHFCLLFAFLGFGKCWGLLYRGECLSVPFSERVRRGRLEDVEILDFEVNIDLGIGMPLPGRPLFLLELDLGCEHDWKRLLLCDFEHVVVEQGRRRLAAALPLHRGWLLLALPQLSHPKVLVEILAVTQSQAPFLLC